MGKTNRKRLGELLDNISKEQSHENKQGNIHHNTGSDTFQNQPSQEKETDYNTSWNPVTDPGLFDKTLEITDRHTQGLTAPLTDPREIGRFATILKTLNFTTPKLSEPHGTSIRKVTSQLNKFIEECELTDVSPQLQTLKFHASILETAGIPWSITEMYVKVKKDGFSNTTPALEIGIPSSKTGKNAFAEGVRDASHTPFEKELSGYVRKSIQVSGYTFYPLFINRTGGVSHPGVLESHVSPGGGNDEILGYEHKGVIKSSVDDITCKKEPSNKSLSDNWEDNWENWWDNIDFNRGNVTITKN